MPMIGNDEPYPAVAVLVLGPGDKRCHPIACLLHALEESSVLIGVHPAGQPFGKKVVMARL